LKLIKEFLKELYKNIRENETTDVGAQLSYYFILSVFPFLIILITLIDYTPLNKQDSLEQLSLLLPEAAFAIVSQIILEVAAADNFTLISFGILATIWTASRGITALIKSINRAYSFTENRSFFRLNAIGVFATFSMVMVVLFTIIFLIFGKVISKLALEYFNPGGLSSLLWTLLRYTIPMLVIFVNFTLLFLYAPNYPLKLRHVYPGVLFSTLAWITTSQIFAFYVNNFGNYTLTYGSIGGVIVFMLWFYISSVVVMLGGDINATFYSIFYQPRNNISA
jgi:membrane protein